MSSDPLRPLTSLERELARALRGTGGGELVEPILDVLARRFATPAESFRAAARPQMEPPYLSPVALALLEGLARAHPHTVTRRQLTAAHQSLRHSDKAGYPAAAMAHLTNLKLVERLPVSAEFRITACGRAWLEANPREKPVG